MKVFVALALWIGVALASEYREKRQAQEPVLPNVCLSAGGRVYFPHPTDTRKFIQCADNGRMFVIMCPMGEMYNQATTSCTGAQPVMTTPLATLPPATAAPYNPCTGANMAAGMIFFAYPGDNKKFYECNLQGQPILLMCPSRLVFDNTRKSCVLPAGTNTGGTNTGTGTTTGTNTGTGSGTATSGNPCPANPTGELFFPFPSDRSHYIQCDLAGNAYVMMCPAFLVWNVHTNLCDSPYQYVTSGNGLVG